VRLSLLAVAYDQQGDFFGRNLYIFAMCSIKAAILLEWLRIFVPQRHNFLFWTLCITLVVNSLFYLGMFIALQSACRPHAKLWDLTLKGSCIDTTTLQLLTAVLNLTLDFVILLLPQKAIWELNMSSRKRLGVSVIFAVGILYVDASLKCW
jgi:hypothetical protein